MKNFLGEHGTAKIIISSGITVVVLGAIAYGSYWYITTTNTRLNTMTREATETKVLFQSKFDELEKNIADLKTQNTTLSTNLETQQVQTGTVAAQLGGITNSVSVLTKLAQSDPELLKKYSKVYFLNEHYVPLSLATIDPAYIYQTNRTFQIHTSVYPRLKSLLDAATADQISLKIDSAYRSFGTQASLKSSYKFTYGAGTANQFSAEQGYSEHQLGTTVDFTSAEINGALGGFDKTKAYAWLNANAYKYGFILSYPQNNTYYQYEPWHWRYVGVALATKLHQDNTYFYDVDQRIIDGYLVDIFD